MERPLEVGFEAEVGRDGLCAGSERRLACKQWLGTGDDDSDSFEAKRFDVTGREPGSERRQIDLGESIA